MRLGDCKEPFCRSSDKAREFYCRECKAEIRSFKDSGLVVKIQNWSISNTRPYDPPGYSIALGGAVYGHPRFPEGHLVTTSSIRSSEGRLVTTGSTKYRLGRVCPEYRRWLKKEGISYDPKQPVKVINEV